MPGAVRSQSVLRSSARLFVFGLWTVTFGILMLVIFVQLFGSLSTSTSVTTFGQQSGTNLDSLLFDSLLLLYRGGLVTLGIGGLMTFAGGSLIVRVAR